MPEFSKQNLSQEETVRQIVEHLRKLQGGKYVVEGVALNGRTGILVLLPVQLHPEILRDVMAGMAEGIDTLLASLKHRPDPRTDRPFGP